MLIVLAPLLLVILVLVRTTSRGPAIFRQRRVGKDMRMFSVYKFRTMRTDSSDAPHRKYIQALISSDKTERNGNLYKLVVDDRITTVGRFLRKSSLDEVPQLFNVLTGAMSLVGPRPVTEYEVELYPEPYLRRFTVKPGLYRPLAGKRPKRTDVSRDGGARPAVRGAAPRCGSTC